MMYDKIFNENMREACLNLESIGYHCIGTRVCLEGYIWYVMESDDSDIIIAISDGWYRAWDKTQSVSVSYHFTTVDDFWKQSKDCLHGPVISGPVPEKEKELAKIIEHLPHYGHCFLPPANPQ